MRPGNRPTASGHVTTEEIPAVGAPARPAPLQVALSGTVRVLGRGDDASPAPTSLTVAVQTDGVGVPGLEAALPARPYVLGVADREASQCSWGWDEVIGVPRRHGAVCVEVRRLAMTIERAALPEDVSAAAVEVMSKLRVGAYPVGQVDPDGTTMADLVGSHLTEDDLDMLAGDAFCLVGPSFPDAGPGAPENLPDPDELWADALGYGAWDDDADGRSDGE
ncbi:MAG: hypothetical protein FWE61_04700 [Micrococcales bacterium]|nr:hypothetical protein [Micrococcales bacterium]